MKTWQVLIAFFVGAVFLIPPSGNENAAEMIKVLCVVAAVVALGYEFFKKP